MRRYLISGFVGSIVSLMPPLACAQTDAVRPSTDPGAVATEPNPLGIRPVVPGERPSPAAPTAAASAPSAPAGAKPPSHTVTARPAKTIDTPAASREDTNIERLVFDRLPLRIMLPVGRERVVSFPAPIALEVTEGFDTLVRTQLIERHAYLRALTPFESVRVTAVEIDTGRRVVLDFVSQPGATAAASASPIEVLIAGDQASAPVDAGPPTADRASTVTMPALDIVALTRFASQSVYAPSRLMPSSPVVRQVPVAQTEVPDLYRGWRVQTTPIGSWKSGALTVTAVMVRNLSPRPHDIDLQEFRGSWIAASSQHGRLQAVGSDAAVSVVYLVCDRPFDACR